MSTSTDSTCTVLQNTGFTSCYSDKRRNPLWSAYRISAVKNSQTHKRLSRFKTDGRTKTKVSHSDYTHSGYDRGHMAPNYAVDTRYGQDAQVETFLMSNICPQKPNLNRRVWMKLEMLVAKEWSQKFETVWVITGPVFDSDIQNLKSGVEVPDGFFKIVVDEEDGKPRVLAFMMPQDVSGKETPDKFLVSIDAIEAKTGLDFMAELPDDVEKKLEARVAVKLW